MGAEHSGAEQDRPGVAFDYLGNPLAVGDKVTWNTGMGFFMWIEDIQPGGLYREDTHRILIMGMAHYIRPSEVIKVEVPHE